MLKVLMAAHPSSNWVSHKALKGAMFRTACPELLNYCLKHLEGTISQNGMAVKARCSPNSATVEYKLEGPGCWNSSSWNPNQPSREQLIQDLRFLYHSILTPNTMTHCRSEAVAASITDSVTKLLDCKQFVKDYKPEQVALRDPTSISVWCQVELLGEPQDNPTPPQELIILPSNATVADLKREATEAFRQVYAMFKRFSIIEMPDIGRVDDSMTIKFLIGSCGVIRVRGKCDKKYGLSCFRTEKGTEGWLVDCVCGAKDDDGEPMVACDTCGIWQHTRCAGLSSANDIPEQFTCQICVNNNHHEAAETTDDKPLWPYQSQIICRGSVSALSHCMPSDKCEKMETSAWVPQSSTTCRDEVAAARGPLHFV
uniref:Zinc finger PHD-type domain-containing protein n=1 Tax=Kalanchoe fedtschenkoi TaxID=63787 RepID=A0A7N0U4Q6_KALFE